MGHVDVSGVRYDLPDGRVLLDDVSFRVGDGHKVALVGANGSGKTTLLRIITSDIAPHDGAIARSGGLGVMRQFVGQGVVEEGYAIADPTVADLLLSVVPQRVRTAARAIEAQRRQRANETAAGVACLHAIEGETRRERSNTCWLAPGPGQRCAAALLERHGVDR